MAPSYIKEEQQKQIICSALSQLKAPKEVSKLDGPATCFTLLGIEVDTSMCQLRLPAEKLTRLNSELRRSLYSSQDNYEERVTEFDRPTVMNALRSRMKISRSESILRHFRLLGM